MTNEAAGAGAPGRKLSIYMPAAEWQEIQTEARRQGRSVSWIVLHSWRVSRDTMHRLPSITEPVESHDAAR